MSDLVIKVFERSERGKQNKKIRKQKQVPAVVYGNKQKNLTCSLDIRLAEKYSKKEFENKIFTFESENKDLQGLKVIKKACSFHKVKRVPLHMDFLSLDMNQNVRISLDLKFKGVPKGVKEEGGIFNIILRSVEIECLPNAIPPFIEIDVSHLVLNENIHVSDLKIPKNIKLLTRVERTICTVVVAETEESQSTDAKSPEETKDTEKEDKKAIKKN